MDPKFDDETTSEVRWADMALANYNALHGIELPMDRSLTPIVPF